MFEPELLALSPMQGSGSCLHGQAFLGRRRVVLTVLPRVCTYVGWTGGAPITPRRSAKEIFRKPSVYNTLSAGVIFDAGGANRSLGSQTAGQALFGEEGCRAIQQAARN